MHVNRCWVLALCGLPLAAQTPSLATYETNLARVMAQVRAQVAGKPQPRIPLGLQHIPANGQWTDVGQSWCNPAADGAAACTWNNLTVMNAYTDALAARGVSFITLNLDLQPLTSASQYMGTQAGTACTGAACPCTGAACSDCATGTHWNCRTLANYDGLIAHIISRGLKVRLAPEPSSAMNSACGLTSASTEAALENCYKPLFSAAGARWTPPTYGIDSIAILHEPGSPGTWGDGVPMALTVGVTHTFLVNTAAAIRAQQSAIKLGAGVQTMTPSSETPYFNDWLAGAGGMGLDFIGVDLFGSSWDVSQYLTTALALAASWAASAKGIIEMRIDEASRPQWVPQGSPAPPESSSYEGNGDIEWSKGADTQFLGAVIPWAAANGFASLDVFPSPVCIWYTQDQANDHLTGSGSTYPVDVLSHLTEVTPTGVTYARIAAWPAASLQGNARLSGRGRLGQ